MNVMPGMRFGALTTKWSWKNHNFRRIWKCTCECGGYCYVKEDALIKGIVMDCGKCEENIATYEPKLLVHPDFSVIEEFVQAGGKLADDNDKDIIHLRNLFGVITPILSELKWGEQRIAECPDCGGKMIVALSSVNGHAHVVCEISLSELLAPGELR